MSEQNDDFPRYTCPFCGSPTLVHTFNDAGQTFTFCGSCGHKEKFSDPPPPAAFKVTWPTGAGHAHAVFLDRNRAIEYATWKHGIVKELFE